MRIITVSREFGSGGRELGKRMADILGFDYYDREIIDAIAKEEGLNPDYVARVLDNHEWATVPLTFRSSFLMPSYNGDAPSLLAKEKQIIEQIAESGHDCVIVGRNAEIFLSNYNTFNIFVCADMQSKISRCRERAKDGENLSDKEIEKNIRRINKNRALAKSMLTDSEWGDGRCYNLTVNTSNENVKTLAPIVSDYAVKWFESR